jgi:diguanylate cyclase (GGDEF)-like protein/PAS domain S-box-containing protein
LSASVASAALRPLARIRQAVARGFLPFDARDPNAGRYRAKLLHTVNGLMPNLLAAGLLASLFIHRVPGWQAGAWATALLALTGFAARNWLAVRRADKSTVPTEATNGLAGSASGIAAFWGLTLCWLYPMAVRHEGELVVAVVAGMLCAGGYILSPAPLAAIAFVATLGGFASVAALLSPATHSSILAPLVAVYTVTLCVAIERMSQSLARRLIAENEALRQQQVVGLLLKDFEDHASDVLWEIDSRGRIRHASSKLLASFGIEADGQDPRSFLSLLGGLVEPEADDSNSLRRLKRRFAAGSPFSNEAVRLRVQGQTRWWGITAKPLAGDDGRINGWRGVISDVTESKSSHSALYKLAHRCALTGLANRRHFMARLAETLERLPAGASCAILYLDLDNFKKVNDVHGHAMGDALLQAIAKQIGSGLRKGDLAARLGGDEFAILLAQIESEEAAATFAGRLMTRVEPAFRVRDLQLPVGLSIGVAIGPKHGAEPDELMRAADLALYRVKSAGKSSVRIYSPILGREKHRRRVLEEALRLALRKDQLTLNYQPQVATSDGAIVAFEALVRWHHPELGPISPAEFIPIAEETGLIEELGSWVLRTACRHAARWPAHLGLAVNVSPAQAMGESLVGSVRRAIAESGLQIKRLEIEITESIFLNEDGRTLKKLHELRGMGVKIALDDFGVGYSSLGYLRRFPFDSLKIDRAFTGELATSFQARSIVKAIVALADCLGMTTIVEGVEHEPQLEVVRDAGCDCYQGFFCSPPVAPEAVAGLLRSWSDRSQRRRRRDNERAEAPKERRRPAERDPGRMSVPGPLATMAAPANTPIAATTSSDGDGLARAPVAAAGVKRGSLVGDV